MALQPLPVSDEKVMAYQEMVDSLARRYNGYHQAEYDDLFQEGISVVFLCIRKGDTPSKDIVARRMLDWVNKCARRGFTGYNEAHPVEWEEYNDALLA